MIHEVEALFISILVKWFLCAFKGYIDTHRNLKFVNYFRLFPLHVFSAFQCKWDGFPKKERQLCV